MVKPSSQTIPVGADSILDEKTFLTKFPVCRRTLRNYELAGKIPVIKIGRRKFYHWGNVQAALTRQQTGGFPT
jgi:hypothetical protein